MLVTAFFCLPGQQLACLLAAFHLSLCQWTLCPVTSQPCPKHAGFPAPILAGAPRAPQPLWEARSTSQCLPVSAPSQRLSPSLRRCGIKREAAFAFVLGGYLRLPVAYLKNVSTKWLAAYPAVFFFTVYLGTLPTFCFVLSHLHFTPAALFSGKGRRHAPILGRAMQKPPEQLAPDELHAVLHPSATDRRGSISAGQGRAGFHCPTALAVYQRMWCECATSPCPLLARTTRTTTALAQDEVLFLIITKPGNFVT